MNVQLIEASTREAIGEINNSYRLSAQSPSGEIISTLAGYVIGGEALFQPFMAGKASGAELQKELDRRIEIDIANGFQIGIECVESLRKALLQGGLGIDCSNYVYRVLSAQHARLGLDLESNIFWDGGAVLENHATRPDSWSPKGDDGSIRELTDEELSVLNGGLVDVGWVARVFKKDLPFIVGSRHITRSESVTEVPSIEEVMAGDVLALTNGNGNVSHVGVVNRASMTTFGRTTVRFNHSWHSRRLDSGVRIDFLTQYGKGRQEWSHPGLGDTKRYQGHRFLRPIAVQRAHEAASN